MSKTPYLVLFVVLSAALALYSTQSQSSQIQATAPSQLDFVKDMDFKKFMGLWYNIASLPNAIEKNCKCPQSFDTLQSQLVVELAQSCILFGKNTTSKSKAVATVNGYGNWTNWNGPLSAPYWIINLDHQNYQWAVLGQPSRKGFWILYRKPHMDQSLLRSLIDWGTSKQFNMKDIEIADQSCFNSTQKVEVNAKGEIHLKTE